MIVANTRSRCFCGTRWKRESQNEQRYRSRSSSGGCCGGGSFGCGDVMKTVSTGMDLASTRKLEVRAKSEDFRKINLSTCCSCQPMMSSLDMFLHSTMPTVPVQYLSKTSMRALGTCNGEGKPYFALEGLWEFFTEWSAYGAGVPLVLNESGSVVQYYVPYLSGIQLYVESTVSSVITRGPGVDSDGEYSRDSSSDVSSDCELERSLKASTNWKHHYTANDSEHRLADLSLREKHNESLEGFSSDDSDVINSQACPLFEFFERDPPYSRVPLADKISQLACRFPRLMTLLSCDLSPASWMSVAWYPIYRIPTGTTLRDLDACFLTYHSLATPLGDCVDLRFRFRFRFRFLDLSNAMVCVRTPGTPSSKIDRPPISTPGASTRTDRTPILTPGGMSTKTDNYSNGNSNSNRTPGGMACKTDRTPGSARMDRTLISTPGTSTKAASAVVGSGRVKEEKIFVTVRVRPLSNKEIAHRDQIAWECQTDNTISFKISASSHDRPNSSYTFDKVFGPTCRTDDVYEKGAKNVALSALTGINATIFAYGQTSSGKTFTMRGITESAVNDIYSHIQNSPERNFTIKMSALEIYNENVRDLLKPDSGPLRLLDDPEKGTVVEKLEEETVKDNKHLRYLIGICEAQRQVGETSLNDTSSRSHQIIRLTIESSLREASDCVQSFLACLNFVDLAGSERVSQTHTEGTRLKEGCHINRSLLTLTTVIRKLSSGKKGGHVPYRDSKLTRILQLSLGGNARTAIICTLSPALSHVEQSRNTLSFATRAKEVTNTAQVNMVISDKKLVKHLQKEVARLEAELRTPELSRTSEELLMEKEMKIKKMEMEMEALKRDRDLAQSQLDELQKKVNINQPGWNPFESPRRPAKCLTFSGNLPDSNKSRRVDTMRRSMMMRQSSTAPLMLVNEIRKLEHMQEQLGEEAKRALEVLQKEVACHRLGNQDAAETISKLQAEIREMLVVRSLKKDDLVGTNAKGNTEGSSTGATNLKEEITRLHNQGSTIANLEEQLENVQKSLDKLVLSLPNNNNNDETQKSQSKKKEKKKKKMLPLALSNSVNLIRSPCSPHSMMSSRAVAEDENENRNPLDDGDDEDNIYHVALVSGSEKTTTNIPITPSKSEDGNISSRDGTSPCHRRSSSVNVRKMQKMFQNAAEENVRSIKSYVTELKERVAKLQYQKQLLVCQVLELESNETSHDDNNAGDDETITDLQELPEDEESWSSIFKEQRNLIIQLWDVCHVSLIHRTQFYLLFQGDDSSDQIYMEVELRRLTWLQQHFVQSSNEPSSATTNSGADDLQTVTLASSIRALKSEREFLSKRMNSRLSEEEREMLYNKWQIPVYAKQRKLQLACKLWTDPTDPVHIEECAQLVAKLVGFCESGNNMSKAMFELNFALPEGKKPWMLGWNPITNLLRL